MQSEADTSCRPSAVAVSLFWELLKHNLRKDYKKHQVHQPQWMARVQKGFPTWPTDSIIIVDYTANMKIQHINERYPTLECNSIHILVYLSPELDTNVYYMVLSSYIHVPCIHISCLLITTFLPKVQDMSMIIYRCSRLPLYIMVWRNGEGIIMHLYKMMINILYWTHWRNISVDKELPIKV